MTMTSIGDLAQTLSMRRHNTMLKQQLHTASQEVATGKVADVGRALRGDFSPLAAIDASLSRLQAYVSATNEAGLMAGSMQTALAQMDDSATAFAATLLSVSTSAQGGQVDAAGAEAKARLASSLSALNTRVADRAVFAGVESGLSPLPDVDVLLTALAPSVATASSADAVEQAVRSWFADPAGFAALYQGGAPRSALPIGSGESADIDVTALDPGLRDSLAGFAMAALLDLGVLASQPASRSDLARRAGIALLDASSDRSQLSARLGRVQARIEDAAIRNRAETTALDIARLGLVQADPYEAATRLEATETQLQTLYTITARLSRLNLSDYL